MKTIATDYYRYEVPATMPKTDKAGLQNALKMIANRLAAGDASEAQLQLVDLIDSVSSDRVRFNWR